MAWTAPLAYRIDLADGRALTTLHDLREVITTRFAGVTRWDALEHGIRLLLRAAETGAADDIKAATDQAYRVLLQRRLVRES